MTITRRARPKPYTSDRTSPRMYVSGNRTAPPSNTRWTGPQSRAVTFVAATLEIRSAATKATAIMS